MAASVEKIQVRTGQAKWPMSHEEFARRFRARFGDPEFQPHQAAIEQLLAVAWNAYREARKSPVTRKAGPEFADSDYDLSVDWMSELSTGVCRRR